MEEIDSLLGNTTEYILKKNIGKEGYTLSLGNLLLILDNFPLEIIEIKYMIDENPIKYYFKKEYATFIVPDFKLIFPKFNRHLIYDIVDTGNPLENDNWNKMKNNIEINCNKLLDLHYKSKIPYYYLIY